MPPAPASPLEAERAKVTLVVRTASWTAGLLAAVAMLTTSWGGVGPSATFSWHPVLMAIGFSGLMTEGLLSYIATPANNQPQTRAVQRGWHAVLQSGALAAVLGGFITKMPERNKI